MIYVSALSRILILLFIICAVSLNFNFSLVCFLAITLPLFINTILLLFLIKHKEYALEDKIKIDNYKILISYFVFNVVNGFVFPNFSPTDTNLLQRKVNSFIMNDFCSFYKVNKVLITNLSLLVGIALSTLLITFFHELDIYLILSIISLIVFISILNRNTKII